MNLEEAKKLTSDLTLAQDITSDVWSALSNYRWFGKHVEDDALEAAYADVLTAVIERLKNAG